MLIFFGLFSLSTVLFVRHLPDHGGSHTQGDGNAVEISATFKALAVFAMFVYFLAQGVVWACLFLIGINSSVDEQGVTYDLTVSQFTGVAGAFLAAIVATRYGRVTPLSAGIAASIVSFAFMFGSMTIIRYAAAVCLFNFAWNMTHPYLLAAMASFDLTGKVVVYAVAAQIICLAIGPALAASVLGDDDYAIIIQLGMPLFAIALIIILVPVIRSKKVS